VEADPVTIPLDQLGVGACATLHTAQLDPDDADALRAMGLRPECQLRVCKRGEPCIVTVNSAAVGASCRIALARRLTNRVMVRPR
jgi:Fe2+ transport system protein FeoA